MKPILNLKVCKAMNSVASLSSRQGGQSFEYSIKIAFGVHSHIGLGNFGLRFTESGGLSACHAQASCRQSALQPD